VVSFFPVVGIGTPPTPHPQASVPPPPRFWGEGHTRWREKGWESPSSDEGTYTVVLFIYTVRTLWWEGKEGVGVTIEEPGEQCTVVFALIVTEPASECVCVYCSPDSSMGVTVNLSVSGREYGGTHHSVST
jgi:hypothetical protein